jgi:signal transduction histidine kinase
MPGFTRDQAERGGVPKGLGGELAPIAVIAIPLVEAQATVGVLRCAAKSCSPYFFAVHEVFFLEQASALIADWFGRRISTYRARRTNQGIKALVNHVAQLGAELSKLSAGTGEPRFFVGYLENLMRAWKETLPPDSRLCYRELREGGSFQRVQSLPVDRGRKSESVRRGFSWKAYEKAVQSYFDAPGGQWPESPWASESNADFLVFPLSGGHDGIQQVIEVVGPANSSLSELDRQIGYLSSMIAAFANVLSHYVQGEQQAKREQKEAKETEEKTFKLLAHQVRTPLSTSLWALETLVRRAEARPVNPEKLRDTAQDIRQSILRAYRVAQRMRVYSEIAAQDRLSKVEVRDVPVYELAKRVREMAADHQRQSAAKKGMTIQVYARNESGSAPVRADLDLLEQAVEIVLENAVKYGDWHSEIAIELASGDHGRAQLIKVRNSARTTPLRSDEVKRIMEFGVRMDKANKKSGWGAGLYLAQVIVKGHGGELSVSATSEKDKTTIFTLSIPTGLR